MVRVLSSMAARLEGERKGRQPGRTGIEEYGAS
jgi:hypothetical protein